MKKRSSVGLWFKTYIGFPDDKRKHDDDRRVRYRGGTREGGQAERDVSFLRRRVSPHRIRRYDDRLLLQPSCDGAGRADEDNPWRDRAVPGDEVDSGPLGLGPARNEG